MGAAPTTGEASSAIILPVPAAEPLVSGWRARHDASAAAGVPAHVTVIAPFLTPERLTGELLDELRALFGTRAVPRVRFARTGRFPATGATCSPGSTAGTGVLYLAPEPADELRALTEAVVARWPETPPYGGLHDAIVPHLTVAIADEETLDTIERELTVALGEGVAATLDLAAVYIRTSERWRPVASLPFVGVNVQPSG